MGTTLRIASLNIGRGLSNKEKQLYNTIKELDCDICSVSEVDIEYFDEKKPFSFQGYKTYFPFPRPGTDTKRLICFVKDNIDVKQRNDLMSEYFSSVWLEVKSKSQKILISAAYREFSDLNVKEQMSKSKQLDRWKIHLSQVEKASKEGLMVCIGDICNNVNKLL